MNDYEFMLEDRIAKIQAINAQYDLENNAYISFSGGKDSSVLSVLIDLALPNNKIPRIYFNTGIEYKAMVDFVRNLSAVDQRFKIVNSGINIKNMLKENGYPFKSKQHSHNWLLYGNNNEEIDKVIKYLNEHEDMQRDYNYIHNLPKGTKTIIKYIFGVREKTTETKYTEKPINENSKEYNEFWSNNKYKTDYGIIEKNTPNNVVERERAL